MNPFIAEIKLMPWAFAPRYWAACNGSLLSIATNQALFALIGTAYGGDGVSNFKLPDLRGRFAVHQGGAVGGPVGAFGGTSTVTLDTTQIPAHTHAFQPAAVGDKSQMAATGWLGGYDLGYAPPPVPPTPPAQLSPNTIGTTGGGAPHENMQPFGCINFCIALSGIFPTRS